LTSVRFNFGGAERYKSAVLASLEEAIDAVAEAIQTDAKNNMGKGARHTPSAPGTPPNVQTGRLRNSVGRSKNRPVTRLVGTNIGSKGGTRIGYGRLHEFGGTVNRVSKTGKPYTATYPARPWLRPALARQRARMRQLFVERAARALRRRIGGGA